MGGCYATSLGATLHEMGHVFDLVHSDRGIMARGFEDIDLFFTLENPQRNIIQKGNTYLSIFTNKFHKFNLFNFQLKGKAMAQRFVSVRDPQLK